MTYWRIKHAVSNALAYIVNFVMFGFIFVVVFFAVWGITGFKLPTPKWWYH